ncbi:hypothetical protein CAPTEDRAFT_195272 [Capitella teleta]|uniref:Neurotransmitter-gated ion-channel ligand-binding domain-containing protein n=1 Tax=Capitella teleta TaxID=283909 RepID=R7TMT8_CAPTE|nr:hypothetical protein CAPTEDRAFT_195272 [Capitella teleta]|eukprot:ELT94959.1 hypothetical protein CAPTEDRAFT_195272 [Capitella teleta]
MVETCMVSSAKTDVSPMLSHQQLPLNTGNNTLNGNEMTSPLLLTELICTGTLSATMGSGNEICLDRDTTGQLQNNYHINRITIFKIGQLGQIHDYKSCSTKATIQTRISYPSMTHVQVTLLFLLLVVYTHSEPCALNGETCLMKHLKANMEFNDLDVRPASTRNDTVHVRFEIGLIDIDSLELIENTDYKLTVSSWFRYTWNDPRLPWNPEDFGGVPDIRIPTKYIWKPDIVLYNNWTHDVSKLDMDFFSDDGKMDVRDYVGHQSFELTEYFGVKNFMYYPCCLEPYARLSFTMKLEEW